MTRRPELGCGAAIHNAEGHLLLIRRLSEPEAGAWGLPGGKIDFGEPSESAVIREIREELGVTIALNGLACLTETIDAGDGRHWVAPVYAAYILCGEPKIMEPDKHGGWGWFDLQTLPAPLTRPTRHYLNCRADKPDAREGTT